MFQRIVRPRRGARSDRCINSELSQAPIWILLTLSPPQVGVTDDKSALA